MTVADLLSIPTGRKEPFDLPLLLRRIDERTARNGATYFAVEFGDKTGSFSTNCFADNAATRVLTEAGAGAAVKAQGVTDHYNDRLSPRFTNVTVLDEEAAAPYWSQLLETAPEDADAMWAEFLASVEGIPHSGLRETVEKALDDMGERFREAPAGIMMHHAYRHGLLEHTLRMIRAANALLPLYPEVDPSLTLAGIALHDMGKCLEYSEGPAPQRTRTGIMQGHVVLGYRMARRAAMQAKLDPDLTERLEHVILSHQGEPEWGAAVRAATPEAVFVSMIDNLDSRMGMVQRAVRLSDDTAEFSERLPGLMTPLLLTPPATAEPDRQSQLFGE